MKSIEVSVKNINGVNLGNVSLDVPELIKSIVDCCETDKLIQFIKERLIENSLNNPGNSCHQRDLKDFLNLFKD